MKKRSMMAGVVMSLMVGAAAAAEPCLDHPPTPPGSHCHGNGEGCGPAERMAQDLKLSEAQQTKVAALLEAERANSLETRRKLAAGHAELAKAEAAAIFDEGSVRRLAANQAEIIKEEMVLHAKVRHEINGLLTAEQRIVAEKLPPRLFQEHFPPWPPDGKGHCCPPPPPEGACSPPPHDLRER